MRTREYFCPHSEQKRRHHVCLPDILHAGRKEKAVATPATCDVFQRVRLDPSKEFLIRE